MTIGEKIKYYRKQIGITQDRLAELTGIHPVSIRKYEINKMQPQPAQLERIAAALGVSYNALNGIDKSGMRLETVGDLMGILMVLCNSGILQINGERENDYMLKEDTVSIQFNPLLNSYMEINYFLNEQTNNLTLKDAFLNIRSYKIFSDLLIWEKINFLYKNAVKSAGENPNEAAQEALNEILETKEKVELELQKSQMPLTV
ncbi:MAG: helix-turn-helix transcriptional regulator [Firmicutes bacterium]|nr:helix-turn-helix transcriptional regulator [Bacillota bacterium]